MNNKTNFCPSCGCDPCDCGWGTEEIKGSTNGTDVHRKFYHANSNNLSHRKTNGVVNGKKTGKPRKTFKKD